jgi:excisionase family DNA binding protein
MTPSPTMLTSEYLREVLTVEEAAERLKLAPKTIRKLCRSRNLTAVSVQRRWRIPVTAVEDFLRERASIRI